MNNERVRLLKQLFKLQRELEDASQKGFTHIARARKYRINKIRKELESIKQKELDEENE